MPTLHGLHNAPVTKLWCSEVVLVSILASILSIKPRFFLQWSPHIAIYGQWSRLLTHHLAFANSSEVLIGLSLIYYTARPLERIWGSSKFFSFLVTTAIISSIISLIFISLLYSLEPALNFIPPGPFALIAACLIQYYAALPSTYTFKWGSSARFSSKSIIYLAFAQLFLSQIPASSIACLSGALAGALWRSHLLPIDRWRASPRLRRWGRDWVLPWIEQRPETSTPYRSNYVTPQEVRNQVHGSDSSIISDWDVNVRSSVQNSGRAQRPAGSALATARRRAGRTGASSGTATPIAAPIEGPGEATGRTVRGGSRAAVARYLESFTGAENANRLVVAHETSLDSLTAMFPQRTREELSRALQDNDNDIERTAAGLLEDQS